jgi:ABC-type uncharacterized transport system permease subunit
MNQWFLIGGSVFAGSTLLHLSALWTDSDRLKKAALRSLEGALVFWFLLLVCWGMRFGDQGVSRFFLGLAGWSVALLYRGALFKYNLQTMGSFITALSTLFTLFAYLHTQPIQFNAEISHWVLLIHIGLATIGLIAFSFTASFSVIYLIQERKLKSKNLAQMRTKNRLPSLYILDQLCLKGLLVGFPFYTVALLLGSAQAMKSQGSLHLSYIVASGSWLIYGGVLQARLTAGWRGRKAAWLTLIALVGVVSVVAQYSLR